MFGFPSTFCRLFRPFVLPLFLIALLATASAGEEPGTLNGNGNQQTVNRDKREIVFSCSHQGIEGNFDIYIMAADGSNIRQLTFSPAADNWPSISPEGEHIAFVSYRDGARKLYVMNTDGSDIVCLTGNYKYDRPAWSPSGKQIAYNTPAGEICVIDIEGREEKQLSHFPGNKRAPSWSPDGKLIAFDMNVDGQVGIYVMNADGTGPRLLAPGFSSADWSPDGSQIVMNGEVDGIIEIYVMNSDGSDIRRLTNRRNHDEFPRWSPDGKSIVFDHHGDSHDICVINADGSNKRFLIQDDSWTMMPDW